MYKNTNVIFRVNSEIKEKASAIAKSYNVSLSNLINAYLIDTVKRGYIPLNLYPCLGMIEDKGPSIDVVFIKRCLEETIEKCNLKDKISKVYLFGSCSRNEANEDSDIDLRIETKNDFTLFDLSALEEKLRFLTGRKIDTVTKKPDKLDPIFYNEIRKDEICIYE